MKIGSQTRKVAKMEKKVKEKRLEACLLYQCSGCISMYPEKNWAYLPAENK